MNFRRSTPREEPEINFIPLIDVLLVILIFLMITTTYSRFSELQITLPDASLEKPAARPLEVNVGISADGRFQINDKSVHYLSPGGFAGELSRAARGDPQCTLVIHADAASPHQAVINVLESARLAGLARVSFAAQEPANALR